MSAPSIGDTAVSAGKAKQSNRRASVLARLRKDAEALGVQCGGDIDETSVALMADIEGDAAAILALVGDEWPAIVTRFVRRVLHSPDGKHLSNASRHARAARKKAVEQAALIAVARDSALYTVTIGERPLADCPRRLVAAERDRSGRRATFLAAVLGLMPAGDDELVRDHVTPAAANELWQASARAPA